MSVKVYQYPKCGTCKKALKWLDAHGVDYTTVDITEKPPSRTALKKYWKASGLPIKKLFNTAGKSYREGGFKERLGSMSDGDAIEALAADGKLIKRPIVVADDTVLIGFREAQYEEVFG
ncbi:MAG TPA: arsenate reductase family protein [Sandaracinaceae bacterium LLY-WYZ-13_1]|nr:arsenate reductase family protein [Sandaracinaceae bacterium LLY-WYZ-13_1]